MSGATLYANSPDFGDTINHLKYSHTDQPYQKRV